MNNTDKLLNLTRAFIEAQGFEIEEVEIPLKEVWVNGRLLMTPVDGAFSVDYKVTKKVKQLTEDEKVGVFKDRPGEKTVVTERWPSGSLKRFHVEKDDTNV